MSAAVANALEEGTDRKQSVQNLGQPSAGLGTVCTALGRHSVNSAAVGSWWFGDFFFFFSFQECVFQRTRAGRRMGAFFAFSRGGRECLFPLSLFSQGCEQGKG